MRTTILVLAIIFCAPTAVMALTAGRGLVGDSELGAAVAGNVILAKGDKSGTGPGKGGHKGAHKGERKGGQPHDKDKKDNKK
jgi:hypothetical protein